MSSKKKTGLIPKVLKIVAGVLIVIILLVAGLVVFINPIVENAVNVGGPLMLGVPVKIEKAQISLLEGEIRLKQFSIGNPENYSTNRALFAVDSVHVGIDVKSLFSDTITISKIEIDHPQISYEVKSGKSNFDVLMANLDAANKKKKDKKDKGDSDKKVIIEEFDLEKARVSYTAPVTLGKTITLPIPSIKLRDIGKESGGASPAEVIMEILGSLGGMIANAGKTIIDGAGAIGDAVGKGAEAVGGAIGEGAKAVGEGLKKLLK